MNHLSDNGIWTHTTAVIPICEELIVGFTPSILEILRLEKFKPALIPNLAGIKLLVFNASDNNTITVSSIDFFILTKLRI